MSLPTTASAPPLAGAEPGAHTAPASPAQEQLWRLDQRHPGRPVNNLPLALSLDGPLDAGLLATALDDVVARHDIFRTRLDIIDGAAVQVVAPALHVPVPVVDLRLLPAGAREAQAFRLAREEAARPFDPRRLPLLRTQLYQFEATKHILVLTLHRAIFDHDSFAILLRELAACYEARRHATAAALPPLSLQYADYASRQWAQPSDLDWWRSQLADRPAPLHFPSDRAPSAASSPGQARSERLELSPAQYGAVQALAQRTGADCATVFLAAFQALLHRHTGRTDFLLGVGVSDRAVPENAGLLGLLSRVVPLRVRLAGDPAFRAVVEQAREGVRETFAHSAAPFARPEDEAALACPVQFAHERKPTDAVGWPGLNLSELELDAASCPCEFTFRVSESTGGASLRVEYDADRFTAAAVQRFLGHYLVLLQAAATRPQSRLAELPLLTASERRRLFTEWNSTFRDFPRDATLPDLVSAHAATNPDAVAIEAGSRRLTWRELNLRSNQFARHLRATGVRPGLVVGLCVDQSPQLAVALLGIWKAGGAALPIDPSQPGSHLARLLAQGQPDLVFTEAALRHLLPARFGRLLVLETEAGDIRRADDADLVPVAGPDDLGVVLCTSGTGDQPKAVELSQRALVGALHALRRSARLTADDVLLATAPSSSLDGLIELFLPLVFGARVVLAQPADVVTPDRLGALTVSSGATVMFGPPSFWQRLVETGWPGMKTLRIFLTGEPVGRGLVEQLRPRCREAWNLYGTVETAGVGLAAPTTADHPVAHLGRPVANVQVHVLDGHLQPVPVGVVGEIFLGGDTVATGYRRQPDLTANRFVSDPFRRIPGARLFRTGDLARRVPNGEIEFLGRLDHQHANRGVRRPAAAFNPPDAA